MKHYGNRPSATNYLFGHSDKNYTGMPQSSCPPPPLKAIRPCPSSLNRLQHYCLKRSHRLETCTEFLRIESENPLRTLSPSPSKHTRPRNFTTDATKNRKRVSSTISIQAKDFSYIHSCLMIVHRYSPNLFGVQKPFAGIMIPPIFPPRSLLLNSSPLAPSSSEKPTALWVFAAL